MDEKTIEILNIIVHNGSPISAPVILEKLEEKGIFVNIKTVHACISKINLFLCYFGIQHMKIEFTKNVGYYLNTTYFNSGQYRLLKDMLRFNQYLNQDEKDEMIALLDPFRFEIYTNKTNKIDALTTKLATIDKAIKEKMNVSFKYVNLQLPDYNQGELKPIRHYHTNGNKPGNYEVYVVTPIDVISFEGRHYLYANFKTKNKYHSEVRTYRIDRMELVQTVKPTKSNPFDDVYTQDDLNKERKHIENGFADIEAKDAQDVVLVFRNDKNTHSIDSSIIEKFKDVNPKYENYDRINSEFKWRKVTLPSFSITLGFKMWLREQSPYVVVLEPGELKREIQEELDKAVKQYGEF